MNRKNRNISDKLFEDKKKDKWFVEISLFIWILLGKCQITWDICFRLIQTDLILFEIRAVWITLQSSNLEKINKYNAWVSKSKSFLMS